MVLSGLLDELIAADFFESGYSSEVGGETVAGSRVPGAGELVVDCAVACGRCSSLPWLDSPTGLLILVLFVSAVAFGSLILSDAPALVDGPSLSSSPGTSPLCWSIS